MYRIIKIILIIISIAISVNLYAITKPPYPPATGSQILDSINRFIHDTLWWEQGDPLPDTGSSIINAIARQMMNIANYGCTGTSSDGSYTFCAPKQKNGFSGAGATGSWGGDNDPYTGNGGLKTPSVPQNCKAYWASKVFTGDSMMSVCQSILPELSASRKYSISIDNNFCKMKSALTTPSNNLDLTFSVKCQDDNICPERQILDPVTNECVVDTNQCLSPYTLINGVCVPPKEPDQETKRCPFGYELQGNSCVKKPKQECDPAVQNCDENGKSKCICEKLQTIIENQGVQIDLHNRTNERLSDILQEQKNANYKLENLSKQLQELIKTGQGTNANLELIQQQLAVIEQLLKDGVKLDTKPITDKLEKIIENDNKNHEDLKGLIARGLMQQKDGKKPYLQLIAEEQPKAIASAVAPVLASTVKPIIDNQKEQTVILKDIKDILKKDDKDNPLPDPKEPDNVNNNDYDPFGAIKGYNISQNRINAGKQCPADKEFVVMGQTFKLSLSYLCQFFAMLAPVFLSIAYFTGAKIVIKGLD